MSEKRHALTALVMSTFSFTVCFACWVINAVLVTSLVSAGVYSFTSTQVGWLLALPILTGAVARVPLGILTDKIGGRIVFPTLMVLVAIPMFLLSYADAYHHFLLASLGFGLAGGSFAVGIGFTSVWTSKERQGTALGIFGMGNAGAAFTTIAAPHLLRWFTQDGKAMEGWRTLPKVYAATLVVCALAFFLLTKNRKSPTQRSFVAQLAPLKNVIVWRFGLYYFLVFGGFVALAQWIVPYSLNVYNLSLAKAGLLAAAFSLPSGIIRAAGGWMSDRFGARSVMVGVFWSCIISALVLSIPRMEITSPGRGVSAKSGGMVMNANNQTITVGKRAYKLTPAPTQTPAQSDKGSFFMPRVVSWQEPMVKPNTKVKKKQMLARGVTNIYYPANIWIFAIFVFIIGAATGIGKAAVYKFIPDQFPDSVGAVGGMVGLLGAMGGFLLPPLFGGLLSWTGLWSSCWIVILLISIVSLLWMNRVVNTLMHEEAPDLAELVERRPWHPLNESITLPNEEEVSTVEDLLHHLPFFADLTPEELKRIANAGQWLSMGKEQTLFSEGDEGDSLYVILKGQVKVHRSNEKGAQIDLATLQVGDFVGELALLDDETRSADVSTLTPCDLFVLGRDNFLDTLKQSPRMQNHLLAGLSHTIRKGNERFFELMYK